MACGTPVAAYPTQGPLDVVDEGKTGFLHENLNIAIEKCLNMDRQDVINYSYRWSWSEAWKIFKNNLIDWK